MSTLGAGIYPFQRLARMLSAGPAAPEDAAAKRRTPASLDEDKEPGASNSEDNISSSADDVGGGEAVSQSSAASPQTADSRRLPPGVHLDEGEQLLYSAHGGVVRGQSVACLWVSDK